jgi:undecaprenyl pyrophosphate phosphatase UppP
VLGACVLELPKLGELGDDNYFAYGLGFAVSAFVGILALSFLVRVVRAARLKFFAAYTFALALALLLFA